MSSTAAGLEPRGVVVELGAGTCWLVGALATLPGVERAIGVEFSRRRLEELAPVALAALGAPADRVERRLADFFASGLPAQSADLVVFDAAFHHASDMDAIARVAHDLLRPGGTVLLFREPTLALLRRRRDHGVEDEHGSFEHEDTARGYERRLRAAGFTGRAARAGRGLAARRQGARAPAAAAGLAQRRRVRRVRLRRAPHQPQPLVDAHDPQADQLVERRPRRRGPSRGGAPARRARGTACGSPTSRACPRPSGTTTR